MVTLLLFQALLAFSITVSYFFAQEVFHTSGGNAAGSQDSVSYSIGQIFYSTHTGADGAVAEGAQLPWEISVITSIEEAIDINLNIYMYPKPATDFPILTFEDYNQENLLYKFLISIAGSYRLKS